jgi:hypothetical protein
VRIPSARDTLTVVPSPWTTRVTRQPGPEWERIDGELSEAGVATPLWALSSWAAATVRTVWLVSAHDASGRCGAAVAVEVQPTRAIPGHRFMRARHLGAGVLCEAGAAALAAVHELARSEPRVLRLSLEWILRTAEEQARASAMLASLGFTRCETPRNYVDTLVIGLDGSEEDLLASFSATTRRELRGWAQRPVEMRGITDTRYADRLNAISRETFARTGGAWHPRSWEERIAVSAAAPGRSRLVGLFRTGRDDDQALLAFAWGCIHGEFAQYDDAGSTRVEDIKVSMMYPLMWDLIRWARRSGCGWFDMGGMVAEGSSDARAGISEFKRRFSKQAAAVGMEWDFVPRPRREGIARALQRAMVALHLR